MKMNPTRNLLACVALGALGSFLSSPAYASGKQPPPKDLEDKRVSQRSNRQAVSGPSRQVARGGGDLSFPTFNPTALFDEFINSESTRQNLADRFADIAREQGLDAEKSAQLEELAHHLFDGVRTMMSSSLPEGGPLQLPIDAIPADDAFQSALKSNPLLMKYAENLPHTLEDYLSSRVLQLKFISGRLKDFYTSSCQDLFGNDYLSQLSLAAALGTMKTFTDAVVSTAEIHHRRYRNAQSNFTYILSIATEFKSMMGLMPEVLGFLNHEDLFVRRLVATEISSMLDFASLLMPLIDLIFSDEDISGQFKSHNIKDFDKLTDHVKYYHSLRQRLGGLQTNFGNEILESQARQEEERRLKKIKQKEIDDSYLPPHLRKEATKKAVSKTPAPSGRKKKKGKAAVASSSVMQSPKIIQEKDLPVGGESPLAFQPDLNEVSTATPSPQKKEKEIESPSPDEDDNTSVIEVLPEVEEVKEPEERNYLQEWAFDAVQEEASLESADVGPSPKEKPSQPTPASSMPLPTGKSAATSVHTPHVSRGNSRGSQNLRSYHVQNIREMFLNGGYTLETVSENRNNGKAPKAGHFFLAGGFRTFQQIMQGTYNGKMESVVSLVTDYFGGKAHRSSHNTWHFKINSLGTQRNIFWNLDMPQRDNSDLE